MLKINIILSTLRPFKAQWVQRVADGHMDKYMYLTVAYTVD